MGWGTFCHLCFNYFELLESFHSELEGSDGKHLKVLFSLEIGAFTFYQIRHDFATPGVAMMPRVHGLGISAKSNQGSLGRQVATGSAAGVNVAQICTHRFIDYKQILQKSSLANETPQKAAFQGQFGEILPTPFGVNFPENSLFRHWHVSHVRFYFCGCPTSRARHMYSYPSTGDIPSCRCW